MGIRWMVCVAILCGAACATGSGGKSVAPPEGFAGAETIEHELEEVRAIRTAAEDALALSRADDIVWEEARLAVPTPFDKAWFEERLKAHAASVGLRLSAFSLEPMTVPRLDFPATLDPSEPWPIQPKDAILAVPLRFSLLPADPEKARHFVERLPSMGLLFVPETVQVGRDDIEVRGLAFTFRSLDPLPRWFVSLPEGEKEKALPGEWNRLEEEVRTTNQVLETLSRERWKQTKVQAYLRWWKVASERVQQGGEGR